MSDKMKQCKICNTSEKIYDFYDNPKYKDFINFWDGFLCYGELKTFCKNESYNDDFNNNICPFCKNELVDTMLTRDDFKIIGKVSNYNRDLLLAMIELRKKDVIEYQLKMSQFKANLSQQESAKQTVGQKSSSSNQITCPKCGSTNITEGTRGFTLTTGFIGSGNFRYVCKNCGNKWKPGSMLELLQRANNGN